MLNRELKMPRAQIAEDFGIHVTTLDEWLLQERIETGEKPGATRSEHAKLYELRRRNKLLKREGAVLRHAAAYRLQAHRATAVHDDFMQRKFTAAIANEVFSGG